MYQVIIVVHVLLGLGIIGLVLMQQGKGADAGAAFGSGGSGSVFGAQGSASFLSRTTAIFATLFFTTSLTLAILSGKQGKTVDIMEAVESSAKSADVPAAGKTVAPAVSAVNDKPAAVPALDVPASVPGIMPATPVVDSAAKLDENKAPAKQVGDKEQKDAKLEKSDKTADKKSKKAKAESHSAKTADKKSDKKAKRSDKE